ncbi:MAG: hypothetical protein NZ524_11115 [Thiobacillaceae bacterium]|nr:hypothetical protein [Thiobacillaceae bacterium]
MKRRNIERDARPEYAIIPYDVYERLRELIEEAQYIAWLDEALAGEDGASIPQAVAHAILDGNTPLRASREYRGLTQQAGQTRRHRQGLSLPALTGKRHGTANTLARALGVQVDDLV